MSCICSVTVTWILIAPRGPSCRQPISSPKLFTLAAFDFQKRSASSGKGKGRASARPFEFATDSMSVDDSGSDSDDSFIVPDDYDDDNDDNDNDEDEDDHSDDDHSDDDHRPRRGKKKHAKRNVVLSDDEYDDVIIPAVKPEAKPKASVGEMNEDEISTKMQVRVRLSLFIANAHLVLEDDG